MPARARVRDFIDAVVHGDRRVAPDPRRLKVFLHAGAFMIEIADRLDVIAMNRRGRRG